MYSTVRDFADRCLESLGLLPLGSDEKFANPTQQDKYQRQLIIFLDMVQKEVAVGFTKDFLNRRFTITTSDTKTEYPLPHYFHWEGLKPNSFFNVTAGGIDNGRIRVISYQQWQEAYPDPASESRGLPRFIFAQPADQTDVARAVLFPYADDAYLIEGQCRLDAPDLRSGSQQLIFPKRYEHLLFYKVRMLLESMRNEGRQGDAFGLSREIWSEILNDAQGPQEVIEQQDFGVYINPFGRERRTVRDSRAREDVPQWGLS